ncbi:unnamed protein product, partial [Adineta ricciae]
MESNPTITVDLYP